MSDFKTYKTIFMSVFSLSEDELENNPAMTDVDLWDSVGHINLIAELEDAFNIEITMEEMSDLISYEKGIELLGQHGIHFQ